jgi:hypothetical protein
LPVANPVGARDLTRPAHAKNGPPLAHTTSLRMGEAILKIGFSLILLRR